MRGWSAYARMAALAAASVCAATLAHAAAPVVNPPSSVASVVALAPDKIAVLEARVAKLEQLLESQALANILAQLTKLQAEAQRLNGDAELQAHEIEGLKKRQRDVYVDVDNRLRNIEKALAAKGVAPGAESGAEKIPASPVPSGSLVVPVPPLTSAPLDAPSPVAKASDIPREQIMYQRALDALKAGRHDQAITDFQAFLSHYPKSEFAGNAHYWLGEANYATRRYEVAVTHFKKVTDTYPGSTKIIDSTLKLGFSYYELGERDLAHKILSDVVARYPNTRTAQLANERLQKITRSR